MILKCGWCHKEFDANVNTNKNGEYPLLTCYNCGRLLPASKKVSTGNLVGRKHIHKSYKLGDTA